VKKNFLVVALALTPLMAQAGPVEDAKVLLMTGKAAEGAALLERDLPQHLEETDYNYLLGIALLDSGKPGAAVFALERALSINPQHGPARAELARALIALTEFDAARRELLQVKQMPMPADVAAKVDGLLTELDRAISDRASQGPGAATFSAYIEGELGYDTNINTATNSSSVMIPLFGLPASLSGFATAQASWITGVNGGVAVQKRVSDDLDVFGRIDGRFRYHPNQDAFSTSSLAAGGGVRLTRGIDQFSAGLTHMVYYIGQYRNDEQYGVFGQWQRELGRQDVVGVFGQYLSASHPIATALNTEIYLIGGTWTHAYFSKGDPRMTLTLWAADDQERNEQDPTVGRTFYGVKAAGEYSPWENWKAFASLAAQPSRYGGQSPFFSVKRQDSRYDLNAGLAYKPEKTWTLTGQYSYLRNDSNIAINDFSRQQILFTARRDFF
jgi:hypothetical protein